jgi:glycosyltransferase involved in cell wall biosynthesis
LLRVRALVDYRPALRGRTGIGEYVHELARALTQLDGGPEVTAFSASWRDRIEPAVAADLPGVRIADRRLPVRGLTWAWHRLGWPPVEWLAGPCDIAHSPTPLLIPTARAAQVVTVHDLHFLRPGAAGAGDPRQHDFPQLIHDHVRRADHVIAVSRYTAGLVERELGIPPRQITTTTHGAPRWADDVRRRRGSQVGRTFLFIGTLEPRKNVGLLLDAYARLRSRRPDAPNLVLAGGVTEAGRSWVERARTAPLAPHVSVAGYVSEIDRHALFADARAVVVPSLDEGFGLPALEAMACGIPVVATPVGALPEVLGEAGTFAPPDAPDAWAAALEGCLDDAWCRTQAARGLERARAFSWASTARTTLGAYQAAVEARGRRT